MSFVKINRDIAKLEKLVEKLKEKKKLIIRNYFIWCDKCGRRSVLGRWKFIQDMFYIKPYSRNEGGYWKNSPIENCYIVCHNCTSENCIYNHAQKEKILYLLKNNHFSKEELFAEIL